MFAVTNDDPRRAPGERSIASRWHAKSYFSSAAALCGHAMQEKRIHQVFRITVALKGLHGLVEVVGGIALALFSTDSILRLLYHWDRHEWVARHFNTGEHHYYVWFFLSHGALNLGLAIGLLLEKLWAYPAAMVVLALFILLQMHRFMHVHDPGLIVFSILDAIVIALAVHEYRLLRKHLPTH
jgi:uncharacterized membrane protein